MEDEVAQETPDAKPTDLAEEEEEEDQEYGLRGLADLPLLEQVHRLFHAIQHKYPYQQTNAWKSLPLEQKRTMLQYIRAKRSSRGTSAGAKKAMTVSSTTASTATTTTAANDSVNALPGATKADPPSSEAPTAPLPAAATTERKADPYLQMLQRRSLRSTPMPGSDAGGGSGAYVARPAVIPQYEARQPRGRNASQARWKIAESEFYDDECACGTKHEPLASTAKSTMLLTTMSAMMSTFGDNAQSCLFAVKEVKSLVGAHMRAVLASVNESDEGGPTSMCLRTLVDLFHDEAAYYSRWREFRGETKHEANELEDVEEEELAEELDLFAVSEADAIFNEAFLERIRFADERTKAMDWSIYDMFAKGRKSNFMSSKGLPFRQWLRLGKCSRASLEFLNFVTYHNIGRLVEAAIKQRTGGQLQALDKPLLKADITAVSDLFKAPSRPPVNPDDAPPSKTRRIGENSAVPAEESASAAASSPTSAPAASVQPIQPVREVNTRPQRLKRLR